MRQFLIIIACLWVSLLRSQEVIIQPPIFSEFECTEFYQLYTGSIMNFSTETYQANMIIEVDYTSPAGFSSRVADGILNNGSSLTIPPGTIPVNNASYEGFYTNRQITFYDSDFESQIAVTKCLPPGTYEVCLTLVDPTQLDNPSGIISQTCYIREKQMLTQLLLVSPFDEDEITIDLPLFTWTPVTPLIPGASYTIQIVELLADQTTYEAFRANPIFYEQSNLMTNIFQYPVAARTMIPCTRYAWRVMYTLDGSFVSSAFIREPDFLQCSELWSYHKPCDDEEEEEEEFEEEPKQFYKLSESRNQTYSNHKESLFSIELDNPYQEMTRIECVFTEQGGTKLTIPEPDFEDAFKTEKSVNSTVVKQGRNFLSINLDEVGCIRGKHYTMRVLGLKNDLFFNFKYEQDEK